MRDLILSLYLYPWKTLLEVLPEHPVVTQVDTIGDPWEEYITRIERTMFFLRLYMLDGERPPVPIYGLLIDRGGGAYGYREEMPPDTDVPGLFADVLMESIL